MATSKTMHLCGFLIAGPVVHSHAVWRNPAHKTDFLGLAHYADIARTLERGRFDFLFFADRLAIADRYGASHVTGIRHARYTGLPKTRLEHLIAATAINVIRLDAWYTGKPIDRTRTTHLQRLALTAAA